MNAPWAQPDEDTAVFVAGQWVVLRGRTEFVRLADASPTMPFTYGVALIPRSGGG